MAGDARGDPRTRPVIAGRHGEMIHARDRTAGTEERDAESRGEKEPEQNTGQPLLATRPQLAAKRRSGRLPRPAGDAG